MNWRARAEVWLYRRLRPLVIERGGRSLPETISGREERRRPVAVRVRKLAAGALLVAAVGTGGAWFGYGVGHDAGALEGADGLPLDRGGVPGWVEEVCRAEGEAPYLVAFPVAVHGRALPVRPPRPGQSTAKSEVTRLHDARSGNIQLQSTIGKERFVTCRLGELPVGGQPPRSGRASP